MNKKRQQIWDKSNGHCWYCGCGLADKCWHVDHIKPIRRGYHTKEEMKILDSEENKVPACKPCNLFKGVLSLEDFRYEIQQQVDRARKTSVNFRTAERFELIEVTIWPVKFWFEQYFVSVNKKV